MKWSRGQSKEGSLLYRPSLDKLLVTEVLPLTRPIPPGARQHAPERPCSRRGEKRQAGLGGEGRRRAHAPARRRRDRPRPKARKTRPAGDRGRSSYSGASPVRQNNRLRRAPALCDTSAGLATPKRPCGAVRTCPDLERNAETVGRVRPNFGRIPPKFVEAGPASHPLPKPRLSRPNPT